jgi:hypothetical protein
MCHLLRHMQVTVVTTMCTHVMTLNRSCTHTLSCAAGRMSVVKPWEKGNAHGLEFDVLQSLTLFIAGSETIFLQVFMVRSHKVMI